VLKEIAGRIAADEYRHSSCSMTHCTPRPSRTSASGKNSGSRWDVRESDDDELAFSYYCANVLPEKEAITP